MLSTNHKDFKQQMTEARRDQILMGAAQVFSEKGFHKATTKEVARAAGVSEGTIYNYFENKRELLLAMIELIGAQTLRPLVQNQQDTDPKRFLTTLMLDRYRLVHDQGHFLAPIVAEIFADVELREAVYHQVAQPVITHVEQYFQANIEAGKLRPFNPLIVSRSLIGAMMLNSALKVTNLDPRYETFSPEAMIEEIIALFFEGLVLND